MYCKSTVEKPAQAARTDRMPELAQRLRFDLANPLARHREAGADLLQGKVRALADAEAQAENLLLAGGEGGEHLLRLIAEIHADHRLGGRRDRLVLQEIAEMAVLVVADGCLEGNRLLGDLED